MIGYLSVGGNVGDVVHHIKMAIKLLNEQNIKVTKISKIYKTKAWGGIAKADFLNAALEISTDIKPYDLLNKIHQIEDSLARQREVHWGDRTIDIDILILDNLNFTEDTLQIPHKYLEKRAFVLVPLIDVYSGHDRDYYVKALSNLNQDEVLDVIPFLNPFEIEQINETGDTQ